MRRGGDVGAGHRVDGGQRPSRVVGDEARLVWEDECVDVAEARVDALLVPQLLDREERELEVGHATHIGEGELNSGALLVAHDHGKVTDGLAPRDVAVRLRVDLVARARVGEQVKVRRVAAGAAGIRMELEDTNRRRRMLAGGAGNEGLEGGWVQGGLPEGLVSGSALWHPSAVVWQVDAHDVRAMGDGNGAVVVGGGWTDEES